MKVNSSLLSIYNGENFNKPSNDKKGKQSFGHAAYFSNGRGRKPYLYDVVERHLKNGAKPEQFLGIITRLRKNIPSIVRQGQATKNNFADRLKHALDYEKEMHKRSQQPGLYRIA